MKINCVQGQYSEFTVEEQHNHLICQILQFSALKKFEKYFSFVWDTEVGKLEVYV